MRLCARILSLLVCFLFGSQIPAWAQAAPPVITQISPSSVAAGGPTFTLTVTGSGYIANSVVQANGNNRATTFINAGQLRATILAGDIATAGGVVVTVFNPAVGAPGQTSNAVDLLVTNAPPPALTSVSTGLVSPGSDQVRVTLIGTNFRPGAIVVISPPVPTIANSPANNQATDISIDSVQRVSSTLLVAFVSISPDAAAPSLRAVDIVNTDQTNTGGIVGGAAPLGSGTTQPLNLAVGTSLGAPLSVATIAVTHPRDGTLVMQGDEVYGQAVLGGTGTGTVIGQWLWDGNVTEQFAVPFTGGQSMTLKTQRSFPTSFLGVHTVELRITQPNSVLTRPITVVVNAGDWQMLKLLGPSYGAGFSSDAPPRLRWAPVPGAARYQVGFAEQPYLGSVTTWHDVNDTEWEVPRDIWDAQPEGELYWTVRAIETSGQARKAAPLRRILHFPSGALASVSAAPGRTAAGNPLLVWQGLGTHVFYRISVSQDAAGTQVVRRYLTGDPRLDLRTLRSKLAPGRTYYWHVDAVAPDGRVMLSGPMQSFVAPTGPQAKDIRDARFVLASTRTSRSGPRVPAVPDIESQIQSRVPMPDSSVADSKSAITIQLKAAVNPMDIALMVDDTDVTSMAELAETKISYTPAIALAGGAHTVNLTIANEAAAWKFTVQGAKSAPSGGAPAGGYQPGTDAEVPPTEEAGTAGAAAAATGGGGAAKAAPSEQARTIVGPQMQTQVGMNTQWVSGSAADTNAVNYGQQMSYQNGHWHVEMNGSGLLNSAVNPEMARTSHGLVNDYVLRIAYEAKPWGANLRFGILSPALYLDSQYVTAATPRQAVEFTLNTPGGAFAYFVNTNDLALGGGSGITFHQQLMGASWQAPIPPKYGMFRLMWLGAHDTGAPSTVKFDSMGNPIVTTSTFSTPGMGDAYGGLLVIHLNPQWQWVSEYAWSYINPNTTVAGSHVQFGRAWRTGVTGTIHKAALGVMYRDVGPNFGSPANPSLSSLSNPNRRGVDARFSGPTHIGTFGLGYSFLQSNINDAKVPEQFQHNFTEIWSKPLNQKTVISANSRQTLILTGTIPPAVSVLPPAQQQQMEPDLRDVAFQLSLTHRVGKVALSVGGSRDWFTNNRIAGQNVTTSSIILGANWSGPSYFQLNSNFSINWVSANMTTTGETRTLSAYVQPTFLWHRAGLQVAPLISVNTVRTQLILGTLTNDTVTGQYGGRLSWVMPGRAKFNTLSMEGDWTQNKNNLMGTEISDVKVLGLWTIVWGRKIGM